MNFNVPLMASQQTVIQIIMKKQLSIQLPKLETLHHSDEARKQHTVTPKLFPALESVSRPTVNTEAAAYYLNRRPQTLRAIACRDTGPIKPLRINGRLAWPVSALRTLLGVAA